ncbi:MAG: S8 family serine peptidase, partial [Bacteroidota bacterium]
MKAVTLFCFFSMVALVFGQEQRSKYWIYFTAKEVSSLSKNASSEDIFRITGISERALHRRTKVSVTIVTDEDLPVSTIYLLKLKSQGITIENTSRWFNAATAYLTAKQLLQVQLLPFVRSVEPVAVMKSREVQRVEPSMEKSQGAVTDPDSLLYGKSITHMKLINAIAVHKIGIKGRGVLVGMLDTGFRWKLHEAMQKMNVIAEYDFIQKDATTANEGTDSFNQDSHGTSTMSLVGAYKEGSLVSPAYNAEFILGKTEYVPTETNIEEDNYVAGIEWMESMGADIVSSSLGYFDFDPGQKSYVYADLNGRTAVTSKAAIIAARKGVVLCTAMGNEGAGSVPPSLISPADADSIISVGAVNSFNTLAGFSSNGPTSDGRIKPDVMAHGVGTYCATTSSSAGYSGLSNGTSLATPLVAGVAAMVLSAHPELTPVQVRDALRQTASNASAPNNDIGWGTINAYEAVLYPGMVISSDPEISITPENNYSVSVFVVSKSAVKMDSVQLFYTVNNGASYVPITMSLSQVVDPATNSGKYTAVIPASVATPEFYVRAVDATNIARKSPYNAPNGRYNAQTGIAGAPKQHPVPASFVLHQNYPNPFNPATTIPYDLTGTGQVTLKVYDLLGREVRTLVNAVQSPSTYSVPFSGEGISSGMYFYRLQYQNVIQTKRMMLV